MSGKNMTLLNDEMGEVMKLCNESFPTPKGKFLESNLATRPMEAGIQNARTQKGH